MKSRISVVAAAGLVCTLVLPAAPVMAQAQGGGAQPAPAAAPQGPQLQLSQQKIDAFVDAALAVTRVRASWKPKVDAAKTEAEAEQLRAAATAEIRHAVDTAPGITTREYVLIARAAQKDPRLGDMLKQRLRERQQLQQQPKTQ